MFLLAHLSDPHLGPIPTPRLRELANKRGLGLINWYRKRHRHHRADALDAIVADMKAQAPDHIAVTGDLVNISLDEEFARAARWLDTLGKPQDVTLTPGNHDAYIRHAAGHAAEHWGDFMRGDPHPNPPPLAGEGREGAFPFVRRRGPLAIVALTTSLPTGPFMATGQLGGEQLARLAGILIALAREPAFRVVLIHHPPTHARSHYMKRLIDAPILRALLAEHGAELLLHGHDHEHRVHWLDGPRSRIPAVGVPSASAIVEGDDEPAAYNLFHIDGGPGAWQCEMVLRGLRAGHGGVTELKRERLR
ncbi:MAG: metallophosphoesterase [Alphaproteobacteria bacterium]|nr:MAG: metallophosphoesterase [Alphaproteobacteria bacterium]